MIPHQEIINDYVVVLLIIRFLTSLKLGKYLEMQFENEILQVENFEGHRKITISF